MRNISILSAAALLALSACASSRDVQGGNDCVGCHGDASKTGPDAVLADAAPPRDTLGNTVSPRVGAHQAHVRGGALATAVACSSCHPVPSSVAEHVNGVTQVTLRGPSGAPTGTYTPRTGGTAATCASVYCHGSFVGGVANNTPSWDGLGTQSACNTCHGNPPATGRHPSVFAPHAYMGTKCNYCHFDVATDGAITPGGRSLHVNGVKNVTVTNFDGTEASGTYSNGSCNPGCHSDTGAVSPQPWQ